MRIQKYEGRLSDPRYMKGYAKELETNCVAGKATPK